MIDELKRIQKELLQQERRLPQDDDIIESVTDAYVSVGRIISILQQRGYVNGLGINRRTVEVRRKSELE